MSLHVRCIPQQISQWQFWASVWLMLDSSWWHEPFGEYLSIMNPWFFFTCLILGQPQPPPFHAFKGWDVWPPIRPAREPLDDIVIPRQFQMAHLDGTQKKSTPFVIFFPGGILSIKNWDPQMTSANTQRVNSPRLSQWKLRIIQPCARSACLIMAGFSLQNGRYAY